MIATAGTPRNATPARNSAPTARINYRTEDFVDDREGDRRQGADVILDMVGGDYIAATSRPPPSMAGIVQIAFLGGPNVELDLPRSC